MNIFQQVSRHPRASTSQAELTSVASVETFASLTSLSRCSTPISSASVAATWVGRLTNTCMGQWQPKGDHQETVIHQSERATRRLAGGCARLTTLQVHK